MYYTSIRMSTTRRAAPEPRLTDALARALGARRSARLRAIVRRTGLPPESLLDVALELLAIVSRKLSPPPIQRTAVGLGAARWRNVSPAARSELMRHVVEARWAKHRQDTSTVGRK
jgi:hypothetical protein